MPAQEVDALDDVVVKHPVGGHKRNRHAVVLNKLLQHCRRFARSSEVHGLCRVEQLYGQYTLQVMYYLIKFGCGICTHTHMVFLVMRRWDGIYRCRRAQLLTLAHDGGGCILADHKT